MAQTNPQIQNTAEAKGTKVFIEIKRSVKKKFPPIITKGKIATIILMIKNKTVPKLPNVFEAFSLKVNFGSSGILSSYTFSGSSLFEKRYVAHPLSLSKSTLSKSSAQCSHTVRPSFNKKLSTVSHNQYSWHSSQ